MLDVLRSVSMRRAWDSVEPNLLAKQEEVVCTTRHMPFICAAHKFFQIALLLPPSIPRIVERLLDKCANAGSSSESRATALYSLNMLIHL